MKQKLCTPFYENCVDGISYLYIISHAFSEYREWEGVQNDNIFVYYASNIH